jgi:hypothetical protein
MGYIYELVDLEKVIDRYNITTYIETGTGEGGSVDYILNTKIKNIITCEIMQDKHQWLLDKYKDNHNVFLVKGGSVDKLGCMLEMVNKNNTLVFLDAHFPGWGFGSNLGLDMDMDIKEVLPLETEFNILKNNPNLNNFMIVVDDLRVYKEGDYQDGNFLGVYVDKNHPKIKDMNIDFLYNTFKETHVLIEKSVCQGCLIYIPKDWVGV